jgi:hypothetical protein
VDAQAAIGMGATDTIGRLMASVFRCGPMNPDFQTNLDVPNGGVLLGLPALLTQGLLAHTQLFHLPLGYYRLDSLFLLLAFMALARVKTMEALRYVAPGEWGNILGLDRIPEVKTLRNKIKQLAKNGLEWGAQVCRDWMTMSPETTGILYVDGHVRVYSGSKTELPRHYVARQKLCLRATTDYWVNAMDGQPFFMVNKAVDPGLLSVLENAIVPRLEQEVPRPARIDAHRFTLVFDREGYSPEFMARMQNKGIACLTYNKYPGENWPTVEFQPHRVDLASGQQVTMRLAERGTFLGRTLWVREVRKLTDTGHQTSIISTEINRSMTNLAASIFARWSQENFFKYMRQHYNIDRLIDYSLEEIPETTRVVNPQYRELDGEVRKLAARLARKRCAYDQLILKGSIEPVKVEAYTAQKAELREEITSIEKELSDLKACRKDTPRHVTFADLPPEDRFKQLSMQGKHFLDTIKLIAYRAETAMANIISPAMSRKNDARSLLRSLYATEADILPDLSQGILTIRLHQPANHCSTKTVVNLLQTLNSTETLFPGTDLRLVYEMVTS